MNSVFKNLAVELKKKGVVVVVMHPGFVKTGIDPGIWELDEAARKLWGVVKAKGIEETGRFWHREGFELER